MIEDFTNKFLEFCKSKPAKEEYMGWSIDSCALGQFVKSLGYKGGSDSYYTIDNSERYEYPTQVLLCSIGGAFIESTNSYASHKDSDKDDFCTFGELVKRLEE